MGMVQTVEAAIKDKAPDLHRQLAAKGTLGAYSRDLAEQIAQSATDLTQAQRLKEKWDKLGPAQSAARMKMAHALNLETAMADLLEFPQDATSPPKPGAITSSDPTT